MGVESKLDDENFPQFDSISEYVSRLKNRIYFYCDVEDNKVLKLNREMYECSSEIISESIIKRFNPYTIYVHINSFGGSFFSGISAMDEILRIKQGCPITTIVDGVAASAATLISIAGTHRQIKRHGFMLIHQLSSSFWGTYDNFKDNQENLEKFMKQIKGIYKDYTKIPMKKLDEILKRDLYLTSKEALEFGLVDEII